MKLGKTVWLILAIGISVIAFASLGTARSGQVSEQRQLEEAFSLAKLGLKSLQLEELSSQQKELEKQLDGATSQLETAKAMLSQSNESIFVSDMLFKIAEVYEVEITQISSSGLAGGDLEGIECLILPLAVRVEGDIPDLISFITALNQDFVTGIVESVNIGIPEVDSEEKASANIKLVIYAYQEN